MKYTFILILFAIITRITSFSIIACPNDNENCDSMLIEYLKDLETLEQVNNEIKNLHTKLNYLESQTEHINDILEYNIKHKKQIQAEKSFVEDYDYDYDFIMLKYETKLLINKLETAQLSYNIKLNSLYYRKEQIKNISVFYENENENIYF